MTRTLLLAAGMLALSLAAAPRTRADDAQELYEKGRWTEAARAFEERLASKREVATLLALGDCYARLDQLDRAIPRYEEALRLDPRSADARRNLGRALYRAGRYREAATALARGLAVERSFGTVEERANELRLYASALALADDAAAAALALERAVLLAPDDARVRLDLGAAYVRAGRAGEGARSLRAAIAKEPGLLEAWRALGHALAAAHERDEAMVALEMAARLGVADGAALDLLADLQLDAGLAKTAAETYEGALASATGRGRDAETLERLAIARLRSGDPARALAALDEVLAKDPARVSARLYRSDALSSLNRGAEARSLLETLARESGRAGEGARARLARLR